MFKVVLIDNNVFMIVKNDSNSSSNKPLEVHGFIKVETFENKPDIANHCFMGLTDALLGSNELGKLVLEAKKIALNKK